MSLSKEIMATFKAEKQKERVKEKAAVRYLRIRTLLDQADQFIGEAQLQRQLKNKFAAKILRARRELDQGECPSKVNENLQDIIFILKKEVEQTTQHLHLTLSLLRKDGLDDGSTTSRKKDSSDNSRSQVGSKTFRLSKPVNGKDGEQRSKRRIRRSGDSRISADAGDSNRIEFKEESEESSQKAFGGLWCDTQSENDRKKMEAELSEECGTLDTLHYALRILNEMSRPDLTPDEVRHLELTMKRTKRMLLDRKECQKLRAPLESLQYAMEFPKGEREPGFSTALQMVHKAVNAFDVQDGPNRKKTPK